MPIWYKISMLIPPFVRVRTVSAHNDEHFLLLDKHINEGVGLLHGLCSRMGYAC